MAYILPCILVIISEKIMNNAWEDDCDLDNLSDVDLNDEKDYASLNNGAALTAPDAKNDSTKISAGR